MRQQLCSQSILPYPKLALLFEADRLGRPSFSCPRWRQPSSNRPPGCGPLAAVQNVCVDQCLPNRSKRGIISPVLMPAASVQSSTVRFAQARTGTVRVCFPFPIRSAITQCSSRSWRSSILRPTSSARRSPHPIRSARMGRLRLPPSVFSAGFSSSFLDWSANFRFLGPGSSHL